MELDNDDFNISDLKLLRDNISLLQETEHLEIFKIIKQDTDKYSENKNGIFINLSKLSNKTLQHLNNFVYFCFDNKKKLELEKKKRENLKESINIIDSDDENDDSNSSDYDSDESTSDKSTCDTIINNISAFEKEIIYNNNIIDNERKDQKYTGIRAKILKKCKESSDI